MKCFKLSKVVIAAVAAVGSAAAAHAQGGAPILTAGDGKLAAFFDGPSCDVEVALIFRARTADLFDTRAGATAELMNGVTRTIAAQCAQVELVKARGIADDDVVYNGVADGASSWLITEQGRSSGGGFLSSVERVGETPDLPDYLGGAGFVAFGDLVARMSDGQVLCTRFDAATNTCSLVTQFENESADGATMVTRQLMDDKGAVGQVSLAGLVEDGLWCGDPGDAVVTASGGDLVDGSRAQDAMEEMLLERVQDVGDKVCVGYADRSDGLTTAQFDGEGFQLFADMPIAPMDEAPGLRRE